MNELIVPPAPNWFNNSVFICTSDNTLIYGSRKDIVLIYHDEQWQISDLKTIIGAHGDRINSVSANNGSWSKPDKLLVSAGEDKIIHLWDLDKLALKSSHKEHQKNSEHIVKVFFAGERIVSVAENGYIVIWHFALSKFNIISNLFHKKTVVKCVETCPHLTWLTAFGLQSGLVIVADLRNRGIILHKMRGHDHAISGLSWCPMSGNIYNIAQENSIINYMKTVSNQSKTKKVKVKKDKTETKIKDYSSEVIVYPIVSEIVDTAIKHITKLKIDTESVENANCIDLNTNLSTEEEKSRNDAEENDITAITHITELKIDTECVENTVNTSLGIDFNPNLSTEAEKSKNESDENDIIEPRKVYSYKNIDRKNPWGNIEFEDKDDENPLESSRNNESFLEACKNLRKDILSSDPSKNIPNTPPTEHNTPVVKRHILTAIYSRKNTATLEQQVQNLNLNDTSPKTTETILDVDVNEKDNMQITIEQDSEANEDLSSPEKGIQSLTEYLLASVCQSGKINIWHAGTDGKKQLKLNIDSSSSKSTGDKRNRWITVCWLKPDILISSSETHDVYSWNLIPYLDHSNKTLNLSAIFKSRLLHRNHTNHIFTITAPFCLYSPDQLFTLFSDVENSNVWSMSQDKLVQLTNLGSRTPIAAYDTIGGYILQLSASPVEPSRLALGMGDACIRIFDLSLSQVQHIQMKTFTSKIKSKVTCLDWHPAKENYLAYATFDGRVGQFDIMNSSNLPVLFKNDKCDPIHKIQWGSMYPGTNNETLGLYFSTNGKLYVHDAEKCTKDPIQIPLDECNITTFSWKADYSILAVGTKEGQVKLLNNHLVQYETLYMQKKSVSSIAWHPLSTVQDTSISPFANDLAVVTAKELCIFVYRCINAGQKGNTKVIAQLKGHNLPIQDLSWSPHVGGRLSSCSLDGSVMVWDVNTQTVISTFRGHGSEMIISVLWSPLNADLIITAGKDCTLRVWNISKYPPLDLSDDIKKHVPKFSRTGIGLDSDKPEKKKKISLLPSISRLQNRQGMFGAGLDTCWKLLENNQSTDDNNDTIDVSQLFGMPKDMMSVLNHEENEHKNNNRWESKIHLSLWKGDLAKSIKEAADTGVLNPWIISLAPLVSHKFWVDVCTSYAEILSNEGNAIVASSYFLICHKVQNAIDILCQHHLYREALAIAQCRLPSDELINSILEKWAQFELYVGNYETAAQCFIKLGKLSEAGELLMKRPNTEYLKLAAELAKRSGNSNLYDSANTLLKEIEEETSKNDSEITSSSIHICESRFDALIKQEDKEVEE